MKVRCAVVDDEPLALQLIEDFINGTPFLILLGAYKDPIEILNLLANEEPDLVFLDINMPGLGGMELARIIRSERNKQTKIIFTSAYNEFALEGYRVDAVDYLLKPFDYQDFLRASNKVETQLRNNQVKPSLAGESIFLRSDYRRLRIPMDDIVFLEGFKDNVKLFRSGQAQPLLVARSLKNLEDRLPSSHFVRVHRSYIVALHKIKSVTRSSVFIADAEIPVAEQYRQKLQQLIGQWRFL